MMIVRIYGYDKENGDLLVNHLNKEIEKKGIKNPDGITLDIINSHKTISGSGLKTRYCEIVVTSGETDNDFFSIIDILKHEGFVGNKIFFSYCNRVPHQKK